MPFEKGHKLSTGRPKGSLNKANSETKEFIHDLLYNQNELKEDWVSLEPRTKFEIRCRLAPYIFQKPNTKVDITNKEKPWGNQKMIRINGDESYVEDWEKAALWEFHNQSLPLFLDKDIETHMKMERYSDE